MPIYVICAMYWKSDTLWCFFRTRKQMPVWPEAHQTGMPCWVSRSVLVSPSPGDRAHPLLGTPTRHQHREHCSLCVKDLATPCVRTMRWLDGPSLQALVISFPFYFLLCVKVYEMKFFLCVLQNILKGYWWHIHFQSLFTGVLLISERLYNTQEFGSKHR